MPYQATIYQVLLSSPSDLPVQHREIITSAMQMWNATSGRMSKIHFSATDWNTGVNPTYGVHPQQAINDAIVDSSDLAIVVFTGKLGTPTENFESGTVEEIERLFEEGKQVAIFVNRISIPAEGVSSAQAKLRLEEYLESVQSKCFYKDYSSLEELTQSVNTLLQSNAMKEVSKQTLEPNSFDRIEKLTNDPSIGVWASIRKESYQETDSKGKIKNKRNTYIVLNNHTGAPVFNVVYSYKDKNGEIDRNFDHYIGGESKQVGTIPPGDSREFKIMQIMGSSESTTCSVSWQAPNGETFITDTDINLY